MAKITVICFSRNAAFHRQLAVGRASSFSRRGAGFLTQHLIIDINLDVFVAIVVDVRRVLCFFMIQRHVRSETPLNKPE